MSEVAGAGLRVSNARDLVTKEEERKYWTCSFPIKLRRCPGFPRIV